MEIVGLIITYEQNVKRLQSGKFTADNLGEKLFCEGDEYFPSRI